MEMTQMFRTRIKTCPSEINLRESQSESSSMLDWDANLNRRNTFAADKSSSYEWDQSRSSFRSRIRKVFCLIQSEYYCRIKLYISRNYVVFQPFFELD